MKNNVKVNVVGIHMTVTEALRNSAENFAKTLKKYCDDDSVITVNLKSDGLRKIVEVVAVCDNRQIRIERVNQHSHYDLYDTMSMAFDAMNVKISRFREKRSAYRNRESIRFTEAEPIEEENGPRIVRTKNFAIKPMSPEEACLQMEMLGHDFFVFKNAHTDQTSVVYRRNDGNYGQINV